MLKCHYPVERLVPGTNNRLIQVIDTQTIIDIYVSAIVGIFDAIQF